MEVDPDVGAKHERKARVMSVTSELVLRSDDLAVAAVIGMMRRESAEDVRRTSLQAVFALATDIADFDDLGLPDQERLSNALLSLRAQGLAELSDQGFRLTDRGAAVVERGEARRIGERLAELQRKVRLEAMQLA